MLSIQCLSLQICPCLAIYPGHQAVSSVSVLPFDFRFFSSNADHLQDLLELRQFSLFSCVSSSILTDCFIYIQGLQSCRKPPPPPSRCLQIPITSCYSSNLGVGTPRFSSLKSTGLAALHSFTQFPCNTLPPLQTVPLSNSSKEINPRIPPEPGWVPVWQKGLGYAQ